MCGVNVTTLLRWSAKVKNAWNGDGSQNVGTVPQLLEIDDSIFTAHLHKAMQGEKPLHRITLVFWKADFALPFAFVVLLPSSFLRSPQSLSSRRRLQILVYERATADLSFVDQILNFFLFLSIISPKLKSVSKIH